MELLSEVNNNIALPLSIYKYKDIAIEVCSKEEFMEFIATCRKHGIYGMSESTWDNNVNDYTVDRSICIEYMKNNLRFCDRPWYERKHMNYRLVKYNEVSILWSC